VAIRRIAFAAALLCGSAFAAHANTFRWANGGDVNSMDPYAPNETFLLSFMGNISEPLIRRNRQLQVEPALAARGEQSSPTTWRLHLRPGVRFTDGKPLSAGDVVFSIARARGPGSNITSAFASLAEVRNIDDATVELVTARPNPILLEELTNFGILSRRWAEANNATAVADITQRTENFATRNAMNTGPFRLVSREPDRRTVLDVNPGW
jgi:peptide/nickel transport system substrate-binding protein